MRAADRDVGQAGRVALAQALQLVEIADVAREIADEPDYATALAAAQK